ncbi:MAG: hypothetical protein P4L69_19440 [Desulfosporosinus sp.]|nr:hypothetical protein [Desulfosporosinus sp.]
MIDRLNKLTTTYKTSFLLGMMGFNFLLTGVDVLMAHSQNNFFRWELVPLVFSPLAVLAILARLIFPANNVAKRFFQTAMWLGVFVGVAGTFFHLTGNATSSSESFYRLLIEGSPVAAPIAFAGISSYALVTEHYRGTARRSKLLILVGLGFLGAVVAAFLDHARLGFIPSYTLIPIVSGTLAVISCFYLTNQANRMETSIYLSILALNLLVGLLGFGFHVLGDLAGTQSIIWARFLYRNPLLGPLLFCNLSLLGGLSILPESAVKLEVNHREEPIVVGST